jgi:hypothetical protein
MCVSVCAHVRLLHARPLVLPLSDLGFGVCAGRVSCHVSAAGMGVVEGTRRRLRQLRAMMYKSWLFSVRLYTRTHR